MKTGSGIIFQVLIKKNYYPEPIPPPQKIAFRNEDKGNIRESVTRGFTLNRKELIKEGISGRKNSNNMDKYECFPSLQLSKVCLTVGAKIIIMSYMVLHVCRGNT